MSETSDIMKHLGDAPARQRILVLREKVQPILEINLLAHYTDHSVRHCDNMTTIIDELVDPIQNTTGRLTEEEFSILYEACYLHDIGMNYENAGDTGTIRKAMAEAKLEQRWDELSDDTRRGLIRKYHHDISAEMILNSAGASSSPVLGVQLTEEYKSDYVACLCEAHCLDTEAQRYQKLTEDRAGIRISLLSALLRVADILDETRERAKRVKAKLLALDLESQTHWWRHYYVEEVTFDVGRRVIIVWFDFPSERFDEYRGIVPELQMPLIESELARHQRVLNQHGLGWFVERNIERKPYCVAEQMPDNVMAEMLRKVAERRARDAEKHRQIVLQQLKEGQPHVQRLLDELERNQDSLSQTQYLREVAKIAATLWGLGGKRSAWTVLSSQYHERRAGLNDSDRLEIGLELGTMMLEDGVPRRALEVLEELVPLAERLPSESTRKREFCKRRAKCFVDIGAYNEATKAIEEVMGLTAEDNENDKLQAELSELHLIHGDIEQALKFSAQEGEKS